jgi:hypothetical protein
MHFTGNSHPFDGKSVCFSAGNSTRTYRMHIVYFYGSCNLEKNEAKSKVVSFPDLRVPNAFNPVRSRMSGSCKFKGEVRECYVSQPLNENRIPVQLRYGNT